MTEGWSYESKHWVFRSRGPGSAWLVARMEPMAGDSWVVDIVLTFEFQGQHALKTIAPGTGDTLEVAKANTEARIRCLRGLLGWGGEPTE